MEEVWILEHIEHANDMGMMSDNFSSVKKLLNKLMRVFCKYVMKIGVNKIIWIYARANTNVERLLAENSTIRILNFIPHLVLRINADCTETKSVTRHNFRAKQ